MRTNLTARVTPARSIGPEQFMRLFLAGERELYRYISVWVPCPEDAQDVVQETAVALWKKMDQYDPSQPFVAWACRFALIEVRRLMEKRQHWTRHLSDDGLRDLVERRRELAPVLDARREHLVECIEQLPPRHRGVLRSYYFEQTSIAALAERWRRTTGAIYKLLQRTRHRLFECISRKMQREEIAR